MSLFYVSYDLRPGGDYSRLADVLESLKAVKILNSAVCFRRKNTNAKDLTNYFKGLISSEDRLIVLDVADWAVINTLADPAGLYKT